MATQKKQTKSNSNKRSPEDWASQFDEKLAAQRRSIFELGDLLILAKDELSKSDFAKAVKSSGLNSISNANNYIRVAESVILKDKDIQKHLPMTVGALIDLAAWKKEEIGAAIKDGVLHPSSERAKLRAWKEVRHQRKVRNQEIKREEEASGIKHVEYAQDAIVVGYMKADAETWTPDKWTRVFEMYKRLQTELDLDDVFLTLDLEFQNSISEHRFSQIRKKFISAFRSIDVFRDDPYFRRYWRTENEVNEGAIFKDIRNIALYVSSADFKQVQKKLKFSDEDWKSLGVTNHGNATITQFLDKSDDKPKIAKAGKPKKLLTRK